MSKCPVDHNSTTIKPPQPPANTSKSWTSWFWASGPNTLLPSENFIIKSSSNSTQTVCPVPHGNPVPKQTDCPVPHPQTIQNQQIVDDQPKCPVDEETRSSWLNKVQISTDTPEAIEESCSSDKLSNVSGTSNAELPTDRVISSIPRTTGGNWIYPSEKQFFDAMKRKNWEPEAQDMKSVVPIHNYVNETTWKYILNWERSNLEDARARCGGVGIKLVSFKGDPQKLTPRAWVKTLAGGEKPFDRHDWKIDRCGVEVDYVIDYYGNANDVFIDVRPKLNTWEGAKLRIGRAMGIY